MSILKRLTYITFSFILVFTTTFYTYSHANVASGVISLGGSGGSLSLTSEIATGLSNAFPAGAGYATIIEVNKIVTKYGQELAEKDYNTKENLRKTYKSAFDLYNYNTDYYNNLGVLNSAEFEKRIQPLVKVTKKQLDALSSTLRNLYLKTSEVATKVKSKYGQVVDGLLVGVNDATKGLNDYLDELKNTKVRWQTDTNTINNLLDIEKTNNKTLSEKYSLTGTFDSSKIKTKDIPKMSYSDLYYEFDTMKERQDFLFEVSKYYLNSTTAYYPLRFVTISQSAYESDIMRLYNDSYFGSRTYSYALDHFINVQFYGTLSDFISKRSSVRDIVKTSPYLNDVIVYGASSGISKSYNKYEGYVGGGSIFAPASLCSIVSTFNTKDDLAKYYLEYNKSKVYQENRPVNYVMNLGDLSTLQPLTKELAVTLPKTGDIPVVNTTDIPIANDSTLPTDKDLEREKEKGIDNEKEKEKDNTTAIPNISIPGLQTKENIQDFVKSLVIPDENFLKDYVNDLNSKIKNPAKPEKIEDFFNKLKPGSDSFNFPDFYLTLFGKTFKFIDMSVVNNNLPYFHKYTDWFFWLIFFLYNLNQFSKLLTGTTLFNNSSGRSVLDFVRQNDDYSKNDTVK